MSQMKVTGCTIMMQAENPIPLHRRLAGWRIAGWSAAAALLALPAISMQFGQGADWTGRDFAFAGIMLLVTGLAAEGGLRLARSWPHLLGFALAIFAGFFTVWSNLAVGIIGDEDAAINSGFFAALLIAIIAAALLRFRARAMSIITGLLAVSQIMLGLAARHLMPGHGVEWGILAMFAALWLAASLCFRTEARRQAV
ncbi:hypothetical protein [Aurantiacibacter rhizosphaerae]|uniref:Uncharacterized protein n=1 Tax=Aurantiacibacter rhizosphaerae TaxID=2691582 RepID=A0A844XBM8_9SPHN|nr:hypothetical protein [Aurantiacibacter rhizosphaerae]MWV27044.1 hypothetical protein [Aurantiacibacter rhizosphaerae]